MPSITQKTILRLKREDDYPYKLEDGIKYTCKKEGYCLFPMDAPIRLVDGDWDAHADILIRELRWRGEQTFLTYEINTIYPNPVRILSQHE